MGLKIRTDGLRPGVYRWGPSAIPRMQNALICVSSFGFRVPNLGFWPPGFGLRVPGFGFRLSAFGRRISGSGFWGSFVVSNMSSVGCTVFVSAHVEGLDGLRVVVADHRLLEHHLQGHLAHKKTHPPRTLP